MLKLFNDAYYQNKYSCYGFGSDIGSGGGSGGQAEASGGAGGNTGGTGKQGGGGGTNDNLAGKIAAMNRAAAEKAAADKAAAERLAVEKAAYEAEVAAAEKALADKIAADKKAAEEKEKNEWGLINAPISVLESVIGFFTGVTPELDEVNMLGKSRKRGLYVGIPGPLGIVGPSAGITEEGLTVDAGPVLGRAYEFASDVTDDDPTNDYRVFESVVESVKKHSSTYTEEVADAPSSDPPDWRVPDNDPRKNNVAPPAPTPTPAPAPVAQIASNKGLLSQAAIQSQSTGKLSMANRFSPEYYTKEYL
jgi:hypothetical protein